MKLETYFDDDKAKVDGNQVQRFFFLPATVVK